MTAVTSTRKTAPNQPGALRDLAERARTVSVPALRQNIDNTGRAARGGLAVLFLLAGGCLVPYNGTLAIIFLAIGLFSLFEAWKGWCAVRACGIKTRF